MDFSVDFFSSISSLPGKSLYNMVHLQECEGEHFIVHLEKVYVSNLLFSTSSLYDCAVRTKAIKKGMSQKLLAKKLSAVRFFIFYYHFRKLAVRYAIILILFNLFNFLNKIDCFQ